MSVPNQGTYNMRKLILFLGYMIFMAAMSNAQDLAFSYTQGGYNWQGRSTSDSYVLGCGNVICSFNANFTNGANGILIMSVSNPTRQGFIPATYYIYPNNRFDLYANGQKVASGQWGTIQINGSVVTFGSAPKHIHVDKHIPWNLCDICGKHKLYW